MNVILFSDIPWILSRKKKKNKIKRRRRQDIGRDEEVNTLEKVKDRLRESKGNRNR
jgi:hypothetical protein